MKSADTRSCGKLDDKERGSVGPLPNDRRALDGGWGWMCVLGCTFMHFLIGGYGRSYGLIYLELRSHFDSSAALTAWVGGACVAVRMGCSPLSNALSRRYSARAVVFVGGLIVGTGSVLNSFATSTEYLIFSYSLMTGFGGSLVYSPSLVVVGEYFGKRRGIAVGLATAGSGVGAFLGPPLMMFLFERYGFFSGLLIIGAIMFNCCVSGALYRPLEDNWPKHATSPSLKSATELSECDERNGDPGVTHGNACPCTEKTTEGALLDSQTPDDHRSSGRTWTSRLRDIADSVCRILDVDVWKDLRFTLFAASQGLSVMSFMPVHMLAPAAARHHGLTEAEAALVLSAVAGGDFVGRLTSGFFFDLPCVRRHRYRPFSAAMLVMAIGMLLWPFLVSFRAAMVNAAVFGLFLGIAVAQRTNVLCDLVGTERLSGALGMCIAAQGVGVFVGPFVAGLCRDYFGNFNISFMFMAAAITTAGILSYIAGALTMPTRTKQTVALATPKEEH